MKDRALMTPVLRACRAPLAALSAACRGQTRMTAKPEGGPAGGSCLARSILLAGVVAIPILSSTTLRAAEQATQAIDPDQLLLRDYRPRSIFNVPATRVERARFPVIDVHSHAYQDRLLYGTDMGADAEMYRTTFRILETEDEHFYAMDLFNYHWPLHGFGLPDVVLKKVYGENARRTLHPARRTTP